MLTPNLNSHVSRDPKRHRLLSSSKMKSGSHWKSILWLNKHMKYLEQSSGWRPKRTIWSSQTLSNCALATAARASNARTANLKKFFSLIFSITFKIVLKIHSQIFILFYSCFMIHQRRKPRNWIKKEKITCWYNKS